MIITILVVVRNDTPHPQLQPLHGKAAVVKAGLLGLVSHADVEMEFLQGPGVGLGHTLAGGGDEGLRVEES